ncbi:NAD(P)-binding domain-containing protein [Nocardia fluminea]|uniref:NAD(P)-binding domain-containing protein n=1 Tax=Nocardia fluminea TaxID=134984 RepID=UPI000C6FF8D7|nr:NAD(P)-binding domain-containing protein [Nocardia fluminea]
MIDALVIGAGQSGLTAARALTNHHLHPVVLEAGTDPVGSWPHYYDSLTLFSPAQHSSLAGLDFPADPDHYPHRDEVVDYLRRYAKALDADIRTNTTVTTVEAHPEEGFVSARPFPCPRIAGGLDLDASPRPADRCIWQDQLQAATQRQLAVSDPLPRRGWGNSSCSPLRPYERHRRGCAPPRAGRMHRRTRHADNPRNEAHRTGRPLARREGTPRGGDATDPGSLPSRNRCLDRQTRQA